MLHARGLSLPLCCVAVLLLIGTVSATFHTSVSERDRLRCHNGVRDSTTRCQEYANYKPNYRVKRQNQDYSPGDLPPGDLPPGDKPPRPMADNYSPGDFPPMADTCLNVTWETANQTNNWGNCFEMTTDESHRYISTNTVPDFYYNPYCPIGLGYGYCIPLEYELGRCMFPNLTCGGENGPGSNSYGDVWWPLAANYKIPLEGDPTRDDRPGDMYDAFKVGAIKSIGAAVGVAINGIGIFGPNDAGSIGIDEAGFQLACGGHVTPPLSNIDPSVFRIGAPPPSPPLYHFHKAPECLEPFTRDYKGVARGAEPYKHGKLTGWALDGFGIYTFQDVGGLTPIVDECGGHFGPVDDSGEVVYHYHSRAFVPYTLACQGPALGKCDEKQGLGNFCHYGCGAEVCVQPGTDEAKLRKYLSKWDEGWLDKYKVNAYSGAREASLVLTYCLVVIQVARFF